MPALFWTTRRSATAAAPVAEPRPLDLPALLGSSAWARLPAAVQRRFAPGHADATYTGHLDLRCSRWGRWMALAARVCGAPLCGVQAQGLPARVHVRRNAQGGVVWTRELPHPAHPVQSTKELDETGALVERTDGGLAMHLRVFETDGALVFESERYAFRGCHLRLRWPTWLSPGTCRVVHTDLGGGRFRFTLSMVHPWLGETFHQTGVFEDPAPTPDPGAAA